MKKIILLVLTLGFLQSCQVYKPIGINDLKEGKNYKITHINGQKFDAQCQNVYDDSYMVIVNNAKMLLHKSNIDHVEKQKISPVGLIGGLTLTAAGIIILVKDADRETLTEKIIVQ